MARKDDELEDDAPRKPRRRDDDDEFEDRPRKAKRRDDDDEIDERPRKKARRRDDDDDYESPSRKPKAKSKLPMILGILAAVFLLVCGGGAFGLYWLASKGKAKVMEAIDAAGGVQTQNDMKQVGLGMMLYSDRFGGYPTNSYDPAGKPLLSWRVHILPYINEEDLYKQFKLNEPWDSPNNKPLLNRMPRVFLSSSEVMGRIPKGTKTYLRAFSSAGAVMDPKFKKMGKFGAEVGPGMLDFKDGTSNSILIVESAEGVEWTKPDDLNWSGGPLPPMGGDRKNADKFWILFADGSVRPVSKTLTPEQLKAAITIAGGEVVNLP